MKRIEIDRRKLFKKKGVRNCLGSGSLQNAKFPPLYLKISSF